MIYMSCEFRNMLGIRLVCTAILEIWLINLIVLIIQM